MSLDCTISQSSIVVAAQEQLSSDIGGEAIILDIKSGVYYGLNTVGASIWNLIQEPKTLDEIRNALLAEYEVEPEKCDRDLLTLLQEFAAVGLIEVKDEAVA
ncbi:PqqD family peptide modification chaperone [Moorena sp. SIO4G3]|uniref:PqqD family peptide modification chaperone n=1 Tax=Moorena sp. SIO4G3 TaxID=2607821 RepID=UPI0014294BD4|nr:PqqD family peptide modification chaperone [Moorena sp. SIO4G3]NEO81208.1 PqqD family protein [Moorena sp. SIO4G3]